jgi:hypothetical protein
MSLTSTAIARRFKACLEADAELAAWAQATFSRHVTILGGASPKRPAREADAPFVVVDALNARSGQVSELAFEICVDLGVARARDQDVLECKAVLEEQFSAHVERVLAGASANIDFSEIVDEFEDGFDPLIVLEKTITVTVPNVIGAVVDL